MNIPDRAITQRVVVLRHPSRDLESLGPVGTRRRGNRLEPETRPIVEVEDATARERAEIAADPSVVATSPVMPIRLVAPISASDAPAGLSAAGTSWGVAEVGAPGSRYTGAGVTVAVLDTGVDASHPAFQAVEIVSRDFTGTGADDDDGHGTHCAGTLLGGDMNGLRIGVAPGVPKMLAGKVLDGNGGGSSEMLFRSMQWAVDQGARVISMSLGFDFPGMVEQSVSDGWPADLATSVALEAYTSTLRMLDTIVALTRRYDAVVVAAAGNESRREVHADYAITTSLPAAAEGVVSVGAAAQGPSGLEIGPFSNANPKLSAPGVDILSAAAGGGLKVMTGTSMAAPHVAGAAALWWEAILDQHLAPTSETVIAKLLANARAGTFAEGVGVAERGAGMVTAPV